MVQVFYKWCTILNSLLASVIHFTTHNIVAGQKERGTTLKVQPNVAVKLVQQAKSNISNSLMQLCSKCQAYSSYSFWEQIINPVRDLWL